VHLIYRLLNFLVLSTLAKKAEKEGVETYMVTPDKDFMQLVSSLTKMYKPGKSGTDAEVVDEMGVKDRFGVTPDKVIDVLGLTGDTSDNIPGVKGIGDKTAIPLIQEFGSIENLFKNLEKISRQSLREKLSSHKEEALLSKRLVTIETEAPVKINFHNLKAAEKDFPTLMKILSELNFKSLITRLRTEEGGSGERGASTVQRDRDEEISFDYGPYKPLTDIGSELHKYQIVSTEKALEKLIAGLKASEIFAFDMETTSINPLNAEIVGFSFSKKAKEASYVPVMANGYDKNDERVGIPLHVIVGKIKSILESSRIRKCGQNIKYDMLVLSRNEIEMKGVEFDTMIASYILSPEGQHNLDALASQYLNYRKIPITSLIGTGKAQRNMREVTVELVADYACEDADFTFRLQETLKAELEKRRLVKLCDEIEFPLIPVLCEMELNGVKIDVNMLKGVSEDLERQLVNLEQEIYDLVGENFNINSTRQLQEILFNKLKLQTSKKTKTGFSTDVFVLEELRFQHPVAQKLLDYRQLSKLKSTYVDALPLLINPETGRVHTSFNQAVTTTGRLSSSDPNLQNIPIRTEIGREIRRAFVPEKKGWVIMSADYSQIELRIMAHISGDEGLVTAFRSGEDIHATTAAKVFGVKIKDVTPDMRRKAKEVNFGIMYGLGPYGLKIRLGISQTEAREIIDVYFAKYPGVKSYIEKTKQKAREK
jgi:DNA polymerase-1